MKLTSTSFKDNEEIPPRYTCDGEDINPQLTFEDIPTQAKSLALVMDDPDAPHGIWDHWIVWNISPKTKEIKEGQPPKNTVYGKNSANRTEWHGPCPPDREHRYFFTLYALDIILTLPAGSTKAQLDDTMRNHILAKAQLIGRYERVG